MMARLPYVRLIAVLDFAHAFGSAMNSPIGSLARRKTCRPGSLGASVPLALFGCLYLTPYPISAMEQESPAEMSWRRGGGIRRRNGEASLLRSSYGYLLRPGLPG